MFYAPSDAFKRNLHLERWYSLPCKFTRNTSIIARQSSCYTTPQKYRRHKIQSNYRMESIYKFLRNSHVLDRYTHYFTRKTRLDILKKCRSVVNVKLFMRSIWWRHHALLSFLVCDLYPFDLCCDFYVSQLLRACDVTCVPFVALLLIFGSSFPSWISVVLSQSSAMKLWSASWATWLLA